LHLLIDSDSPSKVTLIGFLNLFSAVVAQVRYKQ
jgi:hypothetical protein